MNNRKLLAAVTLAVAFSVGKAASGPAPGGAADESKDE